MAQGASMTSKLLSAIVVCLALAGAICVALHTSRPVMATAPSETIVHVSPTGADVVGCGAPALPCATIGYALSGIGEGGILQVARGIYVETITIPASVELLGGYEEVNWQRDFDAYTTTITGNGVDPTIMASGTLDVTIEGFEITGGGIGLSLSGSVTGWIAGNNIHHNALGLRLSSGAVPLVAYNNISYNTRGAEISTSASLQYNTISHNSISGYSHGAGIYIYGSPQLLSNTIEYNSAVTGYGGGVYVASGNPEFGYNTFKNNQAGNPGYGATGGGIQIECTSCTGIRIHHNVFEANYARANGAGVFTKSFGEIADNVFTHNTAGGHGSAVGLWGSGSSGSVRRNTMTGGTGTAVYVTYHASPLFEDNLIEDTNGAGGYIYNYASVTLRRNRIFRNSGGALLFQTQSSGNLTNDVLIDNTCASGSPGIQLDGGTIQLRHVTLSNNTGGGGAALTVDNGGATVTNSIVVSHSVGIAVAAGANTTFDGGLWFNNGANTSGSGSISVSNEWTGDPAFDDDGYHLLAASAARDRATTSDVADDIDGEVRPVCALPDLGADEYEGACTGGEPVKPEVSIAAIPGTLDALLSWQDNPNNCSYAVHRSTAPYFTPSPETLLVGLPAGTTAHRAEAALGWAETDYFYSVVASNCSGDHQVNSDPVGEFDFALGWPVYRLWGLGFSPYMAGQNPNQGSIISEGQVRQRMTLIAPYVRRIRTFGCGSGLEVSGRIAHELGLEIAAGAWLDTNLATNDAQMACLIARAQAGEVDLAVVGSETLYRYDAYGTGLTEEQLLGYIAQFRAAVPAVPVATADTYDQWLAHPNVVAAVDKIHANYYPYWGGVLLDNAVATLSNWHHQVIAVAGGKTVVIGETGWPSDGNTIGQAAPSPENAKAYYEQFISWARAQGVEYYYFEAFDEAWKATPQAPQEAHWGLWDQDGILKPGMGDVFDGKTVPVDD